MRFPLAIRGETGLGIGSALARRWNEESKVLEILGIAHPAMGRLRDSKIRTNPEHLRKSPGTDHKTLSHFVRLSLCAGFVSSGLGRSDFGLEPAVRIPQQEVEVKSRLTARFAADAVSGRSDLSPPGRSPEYGRHYGDYVVDAHGGK